MSRMSGEERRARAEARSFGLSCLRELKGWQDRQREANSWRQVEGCEERVAYWQKQADRYLKDCLSYAQKAGSWGNRALTLAEERGR